jgi:hypothetical protein
VASSNVAVTSRPTAKVWGNFPTSISVLIVDGLGMPGAGVLVEIDAIAVIDA